MRRSFNVMLKLINSGNLYIEEFSKIPLLPEDLKYTTCSYKKATKKDIPIIASSHTWFNMLSSGRAFFVGEE